jgi:hypothetical protein
MTNTNTQKRCLLIAPKSFYFYSEYISKTISTYNFEVTVSNDEYPENTLGKIMGKLRIPVLLSITRKAIFKKYLDGKYYDLIFIIKGRGLSQSLIQELKHISPKVIGYSFDSFKYHSAPLNWYKSVNKFYTFDYRDSAKYNIPIVELFSSMPESDSPKKYSYEISAIVRNHSDRLEYIDQVLSNLDIKSKFIFIYEQNRFTFFQNFIKSPLLYYKYWKHISFKSLPYSEYTRVLKESNFTIDFAHPAQSGITIRCFEALSSQTKIITNNPYITRYKYFNNKNSIVFDKNSNSISLKQRFDETKRFIPEKHHRSINHFIQEFI